MTVARIYQPSKTSMQSGKAKTKLWILDYNPSDNQFIEPLMGWSGTHQTQSQIQLRFKTSEDAIAYAQRQGLDFIVQTAQFACPKIRSYSDNFSFKK